MKAFRRRFLREGESILCEDSIRSIKVSTLLNQPLTFKTNNPLTQIPEETTRFWTNFCCNKDNVNKKEDSKGKESYSWSNRRRDRQKVVSIWDEDMTKKNKNSWQMWILTNEEREEVVDLMLSYSWFSFNNRVTPLIWNQGRSKKTIITYAQMRPSQRLILWTWSYITDGKTQSMKAFNK